MKIWVILRSFGYSCAETVVHEAWTDKEMAERRLEFHRDNEIARVERLRPLLTIGDAYSIEEIEVNVQRMPR